MPRHQFPTYYDTLGIPSSSSPKEIKDAFLSLSRLHHPDKHPQEQAGKEAHSKFIKILEAYRVLSREDTRTAYDTHLQAVNRIKSRSSATANNEAWTGYEREEWKVESNAPRYYWDETIWEMRDRSQDKYYEERPYYGIKGIKRVGNLWIAGGAVVIMFLGAGFHYLALKKSSTFTTSQLDEKDVRLGKELQSTRKRALENGNDTQIQILEARLKEQEEE